jgi:ferric-dicitrate binding protein FerR (iron transport regulator)
MSISNYLIEKFFQGDCTEEEKQQVMEFFRNNPEQLAQYLTEDSWKDFDPDIQKGAPTEKIRETIEATVGKMQTPVRKIRYAWVAAASVIALVALVFLLRRPANDRNSQPSAPVAAATVIKKDLPLKDVQNNSSGIKTLILPDSSKVELGSHSEISFSTPFTNHRRDIYLKGQATFTVRKDNSQPFVVHSGEITTTVLGTVFSVSDKKKPFTTVHLYSGKVVVKKEGSAGGRAFKDIYLTPGQQLILNRNDFSVQVKEDVASEAPLVTKPPVITAAPQQVMDFTNRPLSEIFALLQKEYNVTITYDAAVLQNMSFTGKLDRNKESLESFLNTLCDLNELILKKISDNNFSIQVK